MIISTSNGSLYFTIFYSLAFLIVFILLIWEGYQRKIQLVPWVLLLIFARISFITGTKIFTFTKHDWWLIFNQATLIHTSEKILLGGIVFGIIAINLFQIGKTNIYPNVRHAQNLTTAVDFFHGI